MSTSTRTAPAGLGPQIRRVRLDAHRTQRSVAQGAGVAAEYLSRLENNRASPTMRTLQKIAETLNVSVSVFFEGQARLEATDRCPISSSGRCILDHLYAGSGQGLAPKMRMERYSRTQLEVLRTCDFLVHHSDPMIQNTLAVLLKSLLALSQTDMTPRARLK